MADDPLDHSGRMIRAGYCPCCGFNFTSQRAIDIDDWRASLATGFYHRGREIPLTAPELSFVHSAMSFPGHFLDAYVLMRRAGLDADQDEKDIKRQSAAIRRRIKLKLKAAGVPDPFEWRRGFGWRWHMAGVPPSIVAD